MEQYVFHVTHECNLRCKYCYEINRSTTYSTEDILHTCDSVMRCKERFSVEFIGGEPLLAFDHIKTAYRYIKDNSDNVNNFVISTNLSFIPDGFVDFLKNNEDISLSVSLDGNAYMNQLRVYKNGRGSHSEVINNIKQLISEVGVDRVAVHMVAHPFNVGYLSIGIKYLYDQGVMKVAVGIIESTMDIGLEFVDRYIKEMSIISREISLGNMNGLSVSELDGLKPESDVRTYVYDGEGKIVFESYGRASEDAITSGKVHSVPVSGESTQVINFIRKKVYQIHQSRMNGVNFTPLQICDHTFTSTPKIELDKSSSISDTFKRFESEFPYPCDIHTLKTSDNIYTSSLVLHVDRSIRFGGKGLTIEASEVSAMAEAIERIESLAVPLSVMGFAYKSKEMLNLLSYGYLKEYNGNDKVYFPHLSHLTDFMGDRFVTGYSLTKCQEVGINMISLRLEHGSNGIASGNTLIEAIIQASCEAFERFCLYTSATKTNTLFDTIDVSTIDNKDIQSHINYYKEQGYDVYIKDVGFGIFPVMGVYFVNNNKPESDMTRYTYICAGSFNSDIAIIRCFTEKAQIGINETGISLNETDPLGDLAANSRTLVDLGHFIKGKITPYRRRVSTDFITDLYEVRAICLELDVDCVFVPMNRGKFPVVAVHIPEISNMNMFYDTDYVKKSIESINKFNFLLGE